MKTNNKMIGSRITQAALLLGVILCAQNVKACWTTLPEPCVADSAVTYDCFAEHSNGTQMVYITGQSYHEVCADAGSHTYGTAQTCQNDPMSDPTQCTWTAVFVQCDGSTFDVPSAPSGGGGDATLGNPC